MEFNPTPELNFLLEADKLKIVNRSSRIPSVDRNEICAEHSWHLALAVLTFSENGGDELNIARALQMALVNDLVEVYTGDHCAITGDSSQQLEKRAGRLQKDFRNSSSQ